MNDWSREDVDQALRGDPTISRRFAESVLHRVHVEVGFTLRRYGDTPLGNLLQCRDDLVQMNAIYLYEDGGKVLRLWDPTKGMNLSSFIGLVVRRRTQRILRFRRGNPVWSNLLASADVKHLSTELDEPTGTIEDELAMALNLIAVRKCMESNSMTERERRIYRAVYIEEKPNDVICEEERISVDSLWQATKRMRDRLKVCLERRTRQTEAPVNGYLQISGRRQGV